MDIEKQLFLDVFAISACIWLLVFLAVVIVVTRFIVKRYEDETDLLSSVFFKEHATFTRMLPGFFSSAIYSFHLAVSCWGWKIYSEKKLFRDVEDPRLIYEKFSANEIRLVKWLLIIGVIMSVHLTFFYIYSIM